MLQVSVHPIRCQERRNILIVNKQAAMKDILLVTALKLDLPAALVPAGVVVAAMPTAGVAAGLLVNAIAAAGKVT